MYKLASALLLTFGLACASSPSAAPIPHPPAPAPRTRPVLPPSDPASLVANHSKVVLQETGDLDLDGDEDVVLIIERKGDTEGKREVMFALRQPDDTFRVGAVGAAALCRTCGGVFGDPLGGITIRKGFVSIEHYGGSNWRWTRIITFKHVDGHWELTRDGGESFHTSEPNKVTETIRTRKDFGTVRFEDFSLESE